MSNIWPGLSLDSRYIHKGGWTNWNEHLFDGGRITTSKQAADLLMVFIGIFFVLMEAGLCSLVTFALFLYHRRDKAKHRSRDALWHQTQTVLRNSGDFLSIGGKYLTLWRTYGWKVILRAMPTVIFALITSGVFLVALPFITTFVMLHEEGNEVLIKSSECGLWNVDKLDDTVSGGGKSTEASIRWNTAMQYVDSCYEGSEDSGLCDNFLIKRKLQRVSPTKEKCPFDESICFNHDEKPALNLATEELDSHWDLGLNAPLGDRVKFRRHTTCAPLWIQDRSEFIDGMMYVALGNTSEESDDTFWASQTNQNAIPAYALHGFEGHSGLWTPIKELDRENAIVSLVVLNNPGIFFKNQCNDPFFSANAYVEDSQYFLPDAPITAVACVEQFEFGNGDDRWTDKMRIVGADHTFEDKKKLNEDQANSISEELELNAKQKATLQMLLWGLSNAGSIGDMIATIGAGALRARKDPGTYGRSQNAIPDNQWEKEVGYWVDIGLATLQLQFVHFATGPVNRSEMERVATDADMLCGSQLIKHTEFENFRRSGFISLAVLGGFLIFFPWVFLKVITHWGRRRHWESILEWISYGEMQLLRMANEGAGVEDWEGFDEEVPLNRGSEIARVVGLRPSAKIGQVSQKAHPRMKYVHAEQASTRSSSATLIPKKVSQDEELREIESGKPSPYTPNYDNERDGLLGDVSLTRW